MSRVRQRLLRCGIVSVVLSFAAGSGSRGCGFGAAAQMEAQTLARPGWQGSGLTTDAWWRRPVIYGIDARSFATQNPDGVGGLRGIVEHLDYLRSLGVDAILLDPLSPVGVGAASAAATDAAAKMGPSTSVMTPPIDPTIGTLDDFDTLSLEASRRNIRIMLRLRTTANATTDLATARFWLNRGVAGFYLDAAAGQTVDPAMRSSLRQMLHSYFGERSLIDDAPDGTAENAAAKPTEEGAAQHKARDGGGSDGRAGSARLVMLPSLLQRPSAAAGSQSEAVIAVAIELHRALQTSLALPANQLPLLATDFSSEPPSVLRLSDLLTLAASSPAPAERRQMAKLLAALLLGTRSAALLNQGQEIGLFENSKSAATASAASVGSAPTSASAGVSTGAPTAAVDAASQDTIAMPWEPPPVAKSAHALLNAPKVPMPNTVATEDADPTSLLNFYRELSRLHHGNTAMRDGEMILLDHSQQGVVAWVRRPKSPSLLTPPIVVLVNLSANPTTLSLKAELTKLGLRGSFLRTVLRSDTGMGSMNLTSMTLPPLTVYIGELRY